MSFIDQLAQPLEAIGTVGSGSPWTKDDGVRARGYLQRARGPEQYQADFMEAAELLADVLRGRRPIWRLSEALTTDDFPILFADITDRAMWGEYDAIPVDWSGYVREERLNDFRQVKRFTQDGLNAPLEEVGQLEEYPHAKPSEGVYQYGLKKYGRRIDLSWETAINNDLGILERMPRALAEAARNGEARAVTRLIAGVNGPNGNFFTGGNGNIVAANTALGTPINPPLSLEAVQAAIQQLATQQDAAGNPIMFAGFELVVPPALSLIADNIINATQVWLNTDGGSTNRRLIVNNTIGSQITKSVNPWIPVVASTANGNTTWFLVARTASGRPAFVQGRLRSEPSPTLWMKSPEATRLGGGTAGPFDGDFNIDAIGLKIRDVHGGAQADPKAAVASNGSGA